MIGTVYALVLSFVSMQGELRGTIVEFYTEEAECQTIGTGWVQKFSTRPEVAVAGYLCHPIDLSQFSKPA